jgi:hypothetical protein
MILLAGLFQCKLDVVDVEDRVNVRMQVYFSHDGRARIFSRYAALSEPLDLGV